MSVAARQNVCPQYTQVDSQSCQWYYCLERYVISYPIHSPFCVCVLEILLNQSTVPPTTDILLGPSSSPSLVRHDQ